MTDELHPTWRALATSVARDLGVTFCGVDLACQDIHQPSRYAILEVNGTPGLDHYASVGADQANLVRCLYARVFNAPPS